MTVNGKARWPPECKHFFMGIVLGSLRRKTAQQAEAGSLPILLCTNDRIVGNTGNLEESGAVSSEKRQLSVGRWSGPALAGWVAKKSRARSSLCAKVFFFVAEPVWRHMGVGYRQA